MPGDSNGSDSSGCAPGLALSKITHIMQIEMDNRTTSAPANGRKGWIGHIDRF
jgi:hypothetical protein